VRRSRTIAAEEPFEQARQLRVGNAAAVVRDRKQDDVALGPRRDRAARAVTCVPDRIRQEVLHEDAQDPRPHRDHDVLGDERHELLRVPLGTRVQRLDDVAHDRCDGDIAEPHHGAARLELAEEEDVVDELGHRLDLLPSLLEQRLRVRARQGSTVEESEQPCKRCAQFVRDRRRETHAELLEWIGRRRLSHDSSMAKVLIVEDDEIVAKSMVDHIAAAGHETKWAAKGEQGLAALRYETPDVVVLDLMLPQRDGWSVIETARAEGIGTPIVVVSARGTEHDRVHALDIGADDYLVKPFAMAELVARVNAAARRGLRAPEPERGETIEIEELRIDPREVQAYIDGVSCDLTPTEFRLLYQLALDRGRVVTRDELLQKLWGRRESRRDRTVDVFVRRLREKIDRRAPRHTFIQTRYGVGYKLEPEPKD
jgi:two-component system alkaline phosphatase synthesis response regulator PhoP